MMHRFLFLLLAAAPLLAQDREQTFFAFDDHGIPFSHNLKVTLVQAEKHPYNPVLTRGPEGAPDAGHTILYGTVIHDGAKFRMWYLAMIEKEIVKGQAPGWWRPMCYAESTDGVTWTKPELGLVEFNGNKKNNICLIQGEPFSMTRVNDFLSVLHDPADPDPAKRYKIAYIAHMPLDEVPGGISQIGISERRWCAAVTATSADGLTWNLTEKPLNSGGERFEVSGLYKFGEFYYATGQLVTPWSWRLDGSKWDPAGGVNGRIMLAYRSPDFTNWSKGKSMSFARPGQLTNPPMAGQQTHMGAGMWNRGNVMVGLYGMWQSPAQPPQKGQSHLHGTYIDLGLIVSNDGIHFREPVPDFAVIARGKEGEWDHIALLQGHAFVNHGDKTMMWYSHWDTGAALTNMEIGLATLRRDGFGHLSAMEDDNDSEFTTAAFTTAKPGQVFLNLDGVTATEPLTVELMNDRDQPIAGQSVQVTANGLRQAVAFPQPLPAGQPLSLKVKFPVKSQAKVYAVYVAE